jgi:hypothetical protein
LAALAVIVLVGVLILAFGANGNETQQFGSGPAGTLTSADTPTATPPPGQSTPTRTPTPTPTPTPAPTPLAAKASVIILNQSGVSGLAAQVRDRLQAGGWTVTGIDDFRGNVPATTVYYPPGLQAAAKALMAQFPEIGRIRPAFSGISATQLTVILSKDFPTSS